MLAGRYYAISLFILLNLNVLCYGQKLGTDSISFPENEEEDIAKQNAKGKTPVYVKKLCKEGEIFYPGDQLDDWVCDCRPGYIYYPETHRCYPAYTKGPCPNEHYLVLPKNKVIPECQPNPCKQDNYVCFRGGCYELGTEGPCEVPQRPNLVGVNETTLEIICTKDSELSKNESTSQNSTCFPISTRFNSDEEGNTLEYVSNNNIVTILLVISDHPHQIVNGTAYNVQRCFVGGIRWTEVRCPKQMSMSAYGYIVQN